MFMCSFDVAPNFLPFSLSFQFVQKLFLFLFSSKKITTTKINLFGKLYVMVITFSPISRNFYFIHFTAHSRENTIWQILVPNCTNCAKCVQFIYKNHYFNDI